MKSFWMMLFFLGLGSPCVHAKPEQADRVVLETSLGKIEIELSSKAPMTAEHFASLIRQGQLNQGQASFYRVITPKTDTKIGSSALRPSGKRVGVIQGGLAGLDLDDPKLTSETFLESTQDTGLKHRPGSVSMARDLKSGKTTSSTEFFISVEGDLEELDAGTSRYVAYQPGEKLGMPVFGQVVSGMDVVREIYALRKDAKPGHQMLGSAQDAKSSEQVHILKAYIKAPSRTDVKDK